MLFAKLSLLILFVFSLKMQAETLTVKDAINYAMKNSPQLLIYEREIQSAEFEKGYSTSLQKPQLIYYEEGVDNYASGLFAEKRFSLYQYIEFPLSTIYRSKAYNSLIESKKLKYKSFKLELKAKVKEAYTTLLEYQKNLYLRRRQFRLADTLMKAVEIRFEAGYVSEIDYLKADIFHNDISNLVQDAKIAFHTARYELFKLIGLDIEKQRYDIVYTDSLVYFDVDIKQSEVLKKLEVYPDYLAEKFIIESKSKFKSEAKSNISPDFNLGYYAIDYGNGFNFQGFEIGISLPIWYYFDDKNRIQQKQIEIELSQNSAQKMLLSLKQNIEMAWHGYNESRKKIIIYNTNIRDKSKRLEELAIISYKEGEIDLLTLIDYENTYIENELNYTKELANFYRNILELEKFMQNEYLFRLKE